MNPANRRTTASYEMDIDQQKRVVRAYYACVSYVDAQVGKIIAALEKTGQRERTIIISTSDHGYHLGEHDMWQKVSIHRESAQVPLIVCVPGKKPADCHSFVELLDLYPTTSAFCGLTPPPGLQGKDIRAMFDDPTVSVRDAVLCSDKGQLYREARWALLSYGRNGELYDMKKDPQQFTNLYNNPEYATVLADMQAKLKDKLAAVAEHDLRMGAKIFNTELR